jgi:uncharacterized protein (TIGR00369 family)
LPADAKPGPLIEINRIIRENRIAEYRSPGLAIGMRPVEFGKGTARWSWNEQPAESINPFGILNGGYLAMFVDELCSTAIGSVLEEGEWAVTVEVKLSYIRALKPGAIEGIGEVIRRTRTIAFLQGHIFAPNGEPAVTASSTWSIGRS